MKQGIGTYNCLKKICIETGIETAEGNASNDSFKARQEEHNKKYLAEKEKFKRFHFIFEEALKSEEDENAELPPGHGNLYTLFSVTVVFRYIN